MNIILCEYAEGKKYNAGNKARTDALHIALSKGYKHVPLFRNGTSKLLIPFQLLRGIINTICRAKKGDKVFIQYPYYPYIINRILFSMLNLGRKLKGFETIVLIHDIINLRKENIEPIEQNQLLTEELQTLDNNCDTIICHNAKMKDLFVRICGKKDKFVILGPFDYIYHEKAISTNYNMNDVKIIIAGNLSKNKCGYLYRLSQIKGVSYNLYGLGYEGIVNDYIHYKGAFPPDELIQHLEGNFGLVWDGDDIDSCTGATGNYLRYNNPHKFSLYIAAGLPLIVWKESALADYVKDNGLGICIDRIEDLRIGLASLTKEQYERMRQNIIHMRIKICAGEELGSHL